MKIPRIAFISLIALGHLIGFIWIMSASHTFPISQTLFGYPALADDYEEEDEESEDDDRPTTPSDASTSNKQETVLENVVEYRPVTKTVIITEPGYDIDSDGDLLVDAIDPDPEKHQREYFTDTDGDAVPDAYDRHHDEDDFAYFDDELDANHNGLLDSFEL